MAAMTSASLSVVNAASMMHLYHQKQQQQLERNPVARPLRLKSLSKGDQNDVH